MNEPMELDPPILQPVGRALREPTRMNGVRASSVPAGVERKQPQPMTGYVYDSSMMSHVHPTEDHPEQPDRIGIIFREMRSQGLATRMRPLIFNNISRQHAILIHSEDHWDKVEQLAYMTPEDILNSVHYYEGLSLYVSPSTTNAAKLSCGGVVAACKAVVKGEVKNSFAIVRPPGHHAEPDEHMGFCFFNNVAVAARVVQQELGVKKVLILDWDVHHGNGTQKAFLDDPSVLYISIHRHDDGVFYPGGQFGAITSCGEGEGLGFSVNIGWPHGDMGDAEYLYAFQRIVMPIAIEFAPDLVIISAGFDAARGDELGECDVTPAGYAHMTYILASLANGKLVVALEGGYNLESIRDSAIAVMRVLIGESPPSFLGMTANMAATETIYQVAKVQSNYWKNVKAPKWGVVAEDPKMMTPLPVLLKQHRARHLYDQYKFRELPIADPTLKEAFNGLALCSSDIFSSDTMILFVHDFGDLHVELMGETMCDVNMEKSFIFDATDEIINWARKSDYSFIDVNVFGNPVDSMAMSRDTMKETATLQKKLLTYIWDNFIELTEDIRVFLVAYAGASLAMTEFFRARDVTRRLSGIVQIVGQGQQPIWVKQRGGMQDWFVKNSVIYTGLDAEDLAMFNNHAGIGRVEVVIPKATRGAIVMKECVPTMNEAFNARCPLGDKPSERPNLNLLARGMLDFAMGLNSNMDLPAMRAAANS